MQVKKILNPPKKKLQFCLQKFDQLHKEWGTRSTAFLLLNVHKIFHIMEVKCIQRHHTFILTSWNWKYILYELLLCYFFLSF